MRKDANIKRYVYDKTPIRQQRYLQPIAWAISLSETKKLHLKINKVNMEGLKPPYLLLCTHMSFVDFKVTTMAIFPHRANYIVSLDGFIKREWLLRHAGGICKRKFTNDLRLVKDILHVLNVNKDILCIYPEARYSEDGTNSDLPESLGKLAKLAKVPVVVLNMHGNYLYQPIWNDLRKRKVDLVADMTQIITKEETNVLSVQEINDRINDAFYYDEWRYQRDNHIKIDDEHRAAGLHRILYQCPHCLKENMDSKGHKIWCNECHHEWELDEYGKLNSTSGETIFDHVPDWYKFQREQVRKAILDGTYEIKTDVVVDSLPNAKGLVTLGNAKFTHNLNGFVLEGNFDGEEFKLHKPVDTMYAIHIEWNFHGHPEAISLSTIEDTFFLYPIDLRNIATKVRIATEELYKIQVKNK
jgi:hypothetical protein